MTEVVSQFIQSLKAYRDDSIITRSLNIVNINNARTKILSLCSSLKEKEKNEKLNESNFQCAETFKVDAHFRSVFRLIFFTEEHNDMIVACALQFLIWTINRRVFHMERENRESIGTFV